MQRREIQGYTLIRPIAYGGMTDLFVAHDTQGERVVIRFLKETYARDRSWRKRFLQGGEILKQINHPSIVSLREMGRIDGIPYMALPYIEGKSLRERLLQRDPLLEQHRMDLLRQWAKALYAIHHAGFLHLDFKPENILVTDAARTYVIDFDLSQPKGKRPVKLSGSQGTPAYMAPEVLTRQEADERADVFSFGVVAYECCTGHKPFERNTLDDERKAQIQTDTPPHPISRFKSDVPPRLEALIFKSLAKEPDCRYPSMHSVIKALK